MKPYSLFIADLHLQAATSAKNKLFFDFLQSKQAKKADALYILGDLFEAWVGDDDNSEFAQQVKSALKQFTDTGVATYFLPGNRDFLVGPRFAQETGCTILTDPSKIDLYGVPTLLTHGDILCANDVLHTRFRKVSHNRFCQRCFLLLPLKLRRLMAQYLRNLSIKNSQNKTAYSEQLVAEAAQKLTQKYQAKQIIHGHLHLAAKYDNRISLGSWDNVGANNHSPVYIIAKNS